MEMLSPYEFVKLQQEIDPSRYRSHYLKPDSQDRETRSIEYYKNIPYIDWQDAAFRNAGLQNHSLSVSGGSSDTQYSVSLNYMNQEGVVITSGFERYTVRLRLDHQFHENFRIGLNSSYAQTTSYGATVRNASISFSSDLTAMYNLWGYRPFSSDASINDFLAQDVDDEIHGTTAGNRVNPITTLNAERRNYNTYDLIANAWGEYAFAKDFKWRSSVGVNRKQGQNEIYYAPGHPATLLTGGTTKGVNGSAQYTMSTRFVNENTLSYSRRFEQLHSLNAVLGFTMESYNSSNFRGEAWQIARDLGISGLDEGVAQPLSSSKSKNTRLSFLGRVQYNYKARYYLTTTFRVDASSKFPPGKKQGFFPSVALMWRVLDDSFSDDRVISNLSIRGSYGMTGNDRVGASDYLPRLSISSVNGYSWANNVPMSGAESTQIGNNTLKWETTQTLDLGVDLSMFNRRVEWTIDLYRKKTIDLLLNAKQPISSGYTSAMMNVGSVENKGLEITLNTNNVSKEDFTWSSNWNISFNRSKVLSLADGDPYRETTINWTSYYNGVPLYIAEVGKPIAMFQGMRWVGNYQINDFTWQGNSDPTIPHAERQYVLKDDVPTNGLDRGQIRPGYIKYMDMADPDLKTINSDDRVIIGDPNPKFTGGVSNTFAYKNVDLNLFVQFSYGQEVMNANRLLFEGTYRYGLNQFASYADRWTPENPNSKNSVAGLGVGTTYYSDRTIEDASYLRLKTVQLGYTLPARVLKRLQVDKVRAWVSAQNLFTWTKYSGFDPEVSIQSSALTPGFDYLSYPRAKTYSAGVSIQF
jgi:TonB-linked SusC/RagA family outer membrane protein